MKARLKLKLAEIKDRVEAEAVVGQIVTITLNQIRLSARMDAEIAAVRERYEASLAMCADELKAKTAALAQWSEAHPEEFQKKRKSIEFVQGRIGFRTDPPTVVLLNRSWSWATVLERLRELRWRKLIRVKREVDKEAVLARMAGAKDKERLAASLARAGIKVKQDEHFFVEPNISDVEKRQVQEA